MGADSAISWTHHTFNPWLRLAVYCLVTLATYREPVRNLETQAWVSSKLLDVMSDQIAAACISTSLTSESVPKENIVAPALVLLAKALVSALGQEAVLKGMTFGPARSPFAHRGADFGARFDAVSSPSTIAATLLCRRAHLESRIGAHFLPLHRRNEGRLSFDPSAFGRFTAYLGRNLNHG